MSETISEAVCYLVELLDVSAAKLQRHSITPWTLRRDGKTWSLSLHHPGPLAGRVICREEDAEWCPIEGYIGLYTDVPPPVLDAIKYTLLDWQAWLKTSGDSAVAQEFDGYAARILAIINDLKADAHERAGSRRPDRAAPRADADSARREAEFVFRRDGDGWFIRAFGKEGHFKNRKGFTYLAVLIERAGKPVPMVELIAKAEGHSPDSKRTPLAESCQPVLDREAKKSLKDHLVKLTADIKQAEERGDVTLAEMLRKEFREVTNHLRVDTTPTGKSRQFGRRVDKMRSQITNALSRAYQVLHDGNMPELADHLKVCISCQGDAFIYLSSPPLPWFLG